MADLSEDIVMLIKQIMATEMNLPITSPTVRGSCVSILWDLPTF